MNRHGKLCIALLGLWLAALFVPSAVRAQDEEFFARYNRFLFDRTEVSARSMGMGGAYSALRDPNNQILGNPAALGWADRYHLLLNGNYQKFEDGTSFDDLALPGNIGTAEAEAEIWSLGGGVAIPFRWGGLSLNYNFREDDVESGDAQLSTQSMSLDGDFDRNQVSFGAGYRVMEQLSIGYRYSYLNGNGDLTTLNTGPLPTSAVLNDSFEFDGHKNQFGLQYLLSEAWAFGLDGHYGFGDHESSISGDNDTDSWSVRGGSAWNVTPHIPLMLALDVKFESRQIDESSVDTDEDLFGVHFGAEYEFYENLFLRAGYQFEDFDFEDRFIGIDESFSINGVTGGVGYLLNDQLSIDYAFTYDATAGDNMTHFVGFGYSF